MPRPCKRRFCRRYRADRVYKPQGIPMGRLPKVEIPIDQFEAMRLCDIEGVDQAEAGQAMGISRGTVQRLLYRGRRRLLEAILSNSAIIINLNGNEVDDEGMRANDQ